MEQYSNTEIAHNSPPIAPVDTAKNIGGTLIGARTEADGSDTRQVDILRQLEPVVEENLHRHLGVAKDWMPHDYVPWDRGRNFAMLGGEDWNPEQSDLAPAVQTAMFVNLLTEDNLPAYHRTIVNTFKADGPWRVWADRWTAEEGRHAIALRDYLLTTRGIDPDKLERARIKHMSAGYDNAARTLLEVTAYVTFQELATRVSHRNTGKASGDPIADNLLRRIAMDENLHMIFYRNIMAAAFEINPNAAVIAVSSQVMNFEMPGAGLPDYRRAAGQIALAEIYDPTQHLEKIIDPALEYWHVMDLQNLSGPAEQARENLAAFRDDTLAKASSKFQELLQRKKPSLPLAIKPSG